MLSVGLLDSHRQFVEWFSISKDVLHEGLLNIGVKETVGEHEIHSPVLQNQGEEFPLKGSQYNWPKVPRFLWLCLSWLFQDQTDYTLLPCGWNCGCLPAGIVEIRQGREEGGALLQGLI